VGGAIGAIAGGLAGKGVAEVVDPTVENDYWRGRFEDEPYYAEGRDFEFYEPAYRAGYEGRVKYDGRTYDEVEDELAADYRRYSGSDSFDEVSPATRAAWERVDERFRSATRN
jgi:hypothetical protein